MIFTGYFPRSLGILVGVSGKEIFEVRIKGPVDKMGTGAGQRVLPSKYVGQILWKRAGPFDLCVGKGWAKGRTELTIPTNIVEAPREGYTPAPRRGVPLVHTLPSLLLFLFSRCCSLPKSYMPVPLTYLLV